MSDSATGRMFYPHFGYALGPEEHEETVWVPFKKLRREQLETAAKHIRDEQHRDEFRAFMESWVPHMENGQTIGETLQSKGITA